MTHVRCATLPIQAVKMTSKRGQAAVVEGAVPPAAGSLCRELLVEIVEQEVPLVVAVRGAEAARAPADSAWPAGAIEQMSPLRGAHHVFHLGAGVAEGQARRRLGAGRGAGEARHLAEHARLLEVGNERRNRRRDRRAAYALLHARQRRYE